MSLDRLKKEKVIEMWKNNSNLSNIKNGQFEIIYDDFMKYLTDNWFSIQEDR